jgi:hypothetical protein
MRPLESTPRRIIQLCGYKEDIKEDTPEPSSSQRCPNRNRKGTIVARRQARVQGVGILPTSREERERQRQETRINEGSALMKIQQKFARLTAKVKQLDCLKEAVELVFGFQGKPDQVESIWSAVILARPRPSLETIVTIRPWGIMLLILTLSPTAFYYVV